MKLSLSVILCLLAGAFTPATAQTVATLVNHGDSANRIDIVLVSEGYTAAELPQFTTQAQAFINSFFGVEIYQDYFSYVNVRTVAIASAQSGADHPELVPPVAVNTAFDATYNCSGVVRLICVNTTKVHNVVDPLLPANQRDYIFVIVNDATYGGSGGSVLVASTNAQVVEIMLHEFGHTHGLLADEYTSQPPACDLTEPTAANATTVTFRGNIKWNAWIDAATAIPTLTTTAGKPGLYLGAKYCPAGMYRPTYNSRMRTLGVPYEQVNDEQMVRRFYNFVSTIDGYSPSSATVSVPRGVTTSFTVTPMVPIQHSLSVAWLVDNVQTFSGLNYQLDTTALTQGVHTVAVQVRDITTWVRSDPTNLLLDTQQWQLTVLPPPSACDINQDGLLQSLDVLRMDDEVLGIRAATHDLNVDGSVNVLDVQKVVNAAAGLGCVTP